MRSSVGTAIATSVLLLAPGCGTNDDTESPPAPTSTSADSPTQRASQTESLVAPLDWQPTGYDVENRVIVGERWTAKATESDVVFDSATNGADRVRLPAVRGGVVNAVLLDGDTAVVSYTFGGETRVGLGYRVDLTSGERTEIVTPEPANGGDWALIEDSLYYPALDEDARVCLATLAVSDGNGEDGWCPTGRVGIAELEANTHGVATMLFDNAGAVSCRTLTLLDQTGVPQPVAGPTECTGWDIAATPHGVIWSDVPRPSRQESAVFHATVDGAEQRLAKGTTGSLTSCGDDTFFVSDPATMTDPARLMRWDGTTLSVAYESASRGNAFLGTPECADEVLTLSSFGEDGDEQVSASVG